MLEAKVRWAVKPQALEQLLQGVMVYGVVLYPQTLLRLGTGAWRVSPCHA